MQICQLFWTVTTTQHKVAFFNLSIDDVVPELNVVLTLDSNLNCEVLSKNLPIKNLKQRTFPLKVDNNSINMLQEILTIMKITLTRS